MLTQERLKELLDYDPESGVFVWKTSPNGFVHVGSRAGSRMNRGYIRIRLDKKFYLAHRLVWLWEYGKYPQGTIDHIDRDKLNNRARNLRECTHAENLQNANVRRDNTTGHKGIVKDRNRWRVSISVDGRRINIGTFKTLSLATAAREAAEIQYHPYRAV